jgi:hypothetical protein
MSTGLDPEEIVETMEILHRRIRERFPHRNLAEFAGRIVILGREARKRAEDLRRPIISLRVAVWTVVSVSLLLIVYALRDLHSLLTVTDGGEMMQGIEAMLSSAFFLGAAALFLFTLESRVKRRRALKAIHELRGLAHRVDMHQLTKDPQAERDRDKDTSSSPRRELTPYELNRYLDYCSELLAIVNKLGALYTVDFDDPVVLSGVDGLQRLADGLSQKIWHKMAMVDRIRASESVE